MTEFTSPPQVPPNAPPMNRQPAPVPGISYRTGEALRRTRPWVLFMSVMLWVGMCFLLIGAVFMLIAGVAGSVLGGTGLPEGVMFVALAMLYGLMSLLYIFPAVFLWRYGSRIGRMLATSSVRELEGALEAQKSFWKFVGISAIVVMACYALGIVAMIVVGIVGALK